MLVKGTLTVILLAGATALTASEQSAVYRAHGADARLFDQYDNDGYSLEVSAGAEGSVELKVRVSDSPLASGAPFPTGDRPRPARVAAPDRDAFARNLAAGSKSEAEAVQRILLGLATRVAYDPDRLRRQDPGAVFSDPLSSVNGVDARYVAFSRRAWTRPQNLALTSLFRTGDLSYVTRRAGDNTLRIRSIAPEASAR